MNNEVMELIEMLYQMVSEAWGVPLGNDKCIVERDKVLDILEEIKAQLPAELSEAKRLVLARDAFIKETKHNAEMIRKESEEKARKLVDEQEIVRVAKTRSSELVADAENKARDLRRAANVYIDDALRRTEEAVSGALGDISKARSSFRSAAGTANSVGTVRDVRYDVADVSKGGIDLELDEE